MQGEMDPFFFLTKHKNFIPHEYPRRTAFGIERRGKRPEPGGRIRASAQLAALRRAARRSSPVSGSGRRRSAPGRVPAGRRQLPARRR